MPDLDILHRGVPSCFHVAYRLMRGGAPDDDVRVALQRGLGLALQSGGGLPELRAVSEVLLGAPRMGVAVSMIASRELIAGSDSRHAHLLRRALQKLVSAGVEVSSIDEAQQVLARQACLEVLSYHVFSRAEATVYELPVPRDEFPAYTERLTQGLRPAVEAMAAQLIADSSGSALRPPRSTPRAHRSTEQMLDDVVS